MIGRIDPVVITYAVSQLKSIENKPYQVNQPKRLGHEKKNWVSPTNQRKEILSEKLGPGVI